MVNFFFVFFFLFGLSPDLAQFVIESRESYFRADDGASERKKRPFAFGRLTFSLSLLPSILQTTRVTK